MSRNLRRRTHLSYFEPEEPNFDEYLYCELCSDFVYDYCSVHGPLLVIPDNKVPVKMNFPPYIPRAALTIPHVFLHLAPSTIPGAGLGVFATLTLPRGVRFGPYRGQRTQNADSSYCWQIYSSNNKRSHVVDAADCDSSNWMRYINCSRHWKEQNLLAYQYKGQLYYRTIKIIPRNTELMVFYGSEFANALHINLSKYNSANYYREIISTSTKTPRKNIDEQDYVTAEHFHFIDENFNDENNKISPEIKSIKTDSPPKKIPRIDNKIKQDSDSKNNTLKIRHKCDKCQKTFSRISTLNEHALTHLDTWKFNCEYCAYRTNILSRYKRHIGYHTNTFEFRCETCSFKTNYRWNFKLHCCSHGNDNARVYFPATKSCKICDFNTKSRKSFVIHMAKHSGNVYKCNNCSYSNHVKYNLSRHIKRAH